MRPRIRSIKPEVWQDEKIGNVSRDARLLFVGLVTMADDDGRIRALPASIIGHVFPYDRDAPRKLRRWLDELLATGILTEYVHDSVPYLAFRHWHRHQRINRATPSLLPAPPSDAATRPEPHVPLSEHSLTAHARIGSDQDHDQENPPMPPHTMTTTPRERQRRRRTNPQLAKGPTIGAFELAAIKRLEAGGFDD